MRGPPIVRTDPTYVLCKRSARDALFACGAVPKASSFHKGGLDARHFDSVAAALFYRSGLTLRDAQECGVFQLMPDGRLLPPEADEPLPTCNGGAARYPSSAAAVTVDAPRPTLP